MSLSFVTALALALPGGESKAEFGPKPIPKWNFKTPSEYWLPCNGGVEIAHAGGERFLARTEGVVLMVDRNGDGKVETKVKGVGGFVALKAKDAQGNPIKYGVRFRKKGSAWEYSTSAAMTGKVLGNAVSLLDLNGNGRWNDYGIDGVIIGGGKNAGLLSQVVSIAGKLHNFEVSEDGREVTTSAWEGETGEIDFSIKSKGKLATLALALEGKKVSFAFHKNGKMTVPAGEYSIAGGLIYKGKEQARIGKGKMRSLNVAAGKTAALSLGGRVNAEFAYEVAGGKLTVRPESLHYFGKAGEEYLSWTPDNKSPKLSVFDSRKKRPVESGRFASC